MKLLATFAALMIAGAAQAQSFPEKEIEILVNYGAGGAVDRTARSVQKHLPDALGQSVVVENVGGAGGRLGIQAFLEKPADGYHVLTSFAPATTYVAVKDPNFSFDDLAIINLQWTDPAVLVAQESTGWKTLEDLITAVRADPGRYTFGSSGATSVGHVLAMDLFNKLRLGVRVVPYQGGGKARAAFLAGEVDMTAAGLQGALRLKDNGLPLALFWDEQSKIWPEAVPVNEAQSEVEAAIGGAYRFHAVHADVKKDHPERFEALVQAFQKTTTENDEFITFADETSVGRDWHGPDASTEILRGVEQNFSEMFK